MPKITNIFLLFPKKGEGDDDNDDGNDGAEDEEEDRGTISSSKASMSEGSIILNTSV